MIKLDTNDDVTHLVKFVIIFFLFNFSQSRTKFLKNYFFLIFVKKKNFFLYFILIFFFSFWFKTNKKNELSRVSFQKTGRAECGSHDDEPCVHF